MDRLIPELTALCWQASDAIMSFYDEDYDYDQKSDGSPLTRADIAAHNIIIDKLKELTPEIPIISEESEHKIDATSLEAFWLVDPLDGTKEFINKNGEFTVNIALIKNKQPILGFVCCPALNTLYVGKVHSGAYKQQRGKEQENIRVSNPGHDGLVVVGSRSHNDPKAMAQFLKGERIKSFIATGSSLKFCRVAEGGAHLYPRLGRTMEWDTAAGHAVLLAAGGIVNRVDGDALTYGKRGLDNPHFIACVSERQKEVA